MPAPDRIYTDPRSSPPFSVASRLLSVASDMFYNDGFHAVGVQAIADAAGTTKPTLYRHFASKDELGAQCVSRIAAVYVEELAEISARFPDSPILELQSIVDHAGKGLKDPAFRGWPVSNAEAEILDPDHPIRRVCLHYKTRLRTHLHEVARRAAVARPENLADGLMLLIEGAAASWRSFGSTGPAASLAVHARALINAFSNETSMADLAKS